MKKRFLCTLLFVLMVFTAAGAQAEGRLLPTAGQLFGVPMPSLSAVLLREADSHSELDGEVSSVYSGVTDADFDAWSVYIGQFGCTLVSYEVKDAVFSAVLEKDGRQMRFSYDRPAAVCTLTYPEGTEEEKVDIAALIALRDAKNERLQQVRTAGGVLVFGHYEQDNVSKNGKEPIEWIVLDVHEGKALLVSKYLLDVGAYNSENKGITWEQCTLRSWLNTGFLKTAFTEAEQAAILETSVTNPVNANINPEGITGGNDTCDRIFLLSYDEVIAYFLSDNARQCQASDYVLNKGISTGGTASVAYWWLRSPGQKQAHAAYVDTYGSARGKLDGNNIGNYVNYARFGIRPALWLDLSADVY